jgi:chromosome condensin MukBEF complex kleisin-like MukF subunit
MLMASALLAMQAGCQQAEDPADVREDTAAADAQQEKQDALAQAEGDYRVAMERCEALAADAQSACRQEAQSMLEAARRAVESPTGPS